MIIALDPSINNTGFAVMQGHTLIESGVIKSRGDSLPEKLDTIAGGIIAILGDKKISRIEKAIVEVPGKITYTRSSSNGKTLNAESMGKCNMAIGVILYTLHSWGIEIETVVAKDWKAGRGKDIDKAVASNLAGRQIKSSDEADAIMLCKWLALRTSR